MIPVIKVMVNNVVIGNVIADDFFNKYGNCDGHNIVGLVAEAYLVKKLRSMGYEVMLVLSHNVEIRSIKRHGFSYDCVGEYGEVLENMPAELKAVVNEMCERGVDIRIENDGDVPVYLEDRMLFKTSFKRTLLKIIAAHGDRYLSPLIIFNSEFEPFLTALSYKLVLMLEYGANIPIKRLPLSRVENLLDDIESILAEKGLKLESDYCDGLKISNESELIEDLRGLWRVFEG